MSTTSDGANRVGESPVSRWLLAIDSSTEQAGVALFDGLRLAELSWTAGRTQTTTLLREVDHLLQLQGTGLGDLAAIAVATGPGTFSGLRVGMGIAKGLVLARGLPLIGIPTLDAAASPFAHNERTVVAVVAAGRGRLVWAVYGTVAGTWQQTTQPINGTATELITTCMSRDPGVTVTGELTATLSDEIGNLPGVTVPSPAHRLRRPGALAALAWSRHIQGISDNPATLEPVYLHGR